MIISIDTTKDKKSDIRAAIVALQKLVNDTDGLADSMSSQEISESASNAFGSMFGDDSPSNSSSTINDEQDKDNDSPSIEMY